MRRLAIFVLRRRWWIIGVALVALPLFAIFGGNVRSKLITGGFDDPNAEATRAQNAVTREFPRSGISDFAILVTAKQGTVDDPAVADAGRQVTKQLAAASGVAGASSYWSESDAVPAHLFKVEFLRSRDSRQALVFAALKGNDDQKLKTAEELKKEFAHPSPAITTAVTGRAEITRELADQAQKDLEKADFLSAPFTFAALLIVFGSLVAAFLPLGVGLIAVLGGFLILTIITGFTDVSVFSLNLVTGLGLGLAIDYSLFIVSRYREELGHGTTPPVAIGRTMQTAGRTVLFSAGTVAISLSTLIIFPMPYLRSFAYAGVAVVALAAISSCIILPAVLAALGGRVEKGRLYKPRETTDGGFWARQANRVMRHPIVYAVTVSLILILLAIPFFHVRPGLSDDRVGPPNMPSHVATDQIRQNFESREGSALLVYIPSLTIRDIDNSKTTADKQAVKTFAAKLAQLPGVYRVDAATGYDKLRLGGKEIPNPGATALSSRFLSPPDMSGTYISVVPNIEPYSRQGEQLVKDIRALRSTTPFDFLVAGSSANLVDTKEAVISRLPLALLLIAVATFILLFMMTGSVLVPIKALVLNVLSLTATFGALVWIFQDGHLSSWLHFSQTGTIDVFTPILLFCIAFGMSMDYEVFLLSRIKEEYDLEHDNERAVASGLQKTGRIVTAAALLLVIVFACIATADVVLVKALGVGLGLAVLVDAFLIRATLVPAFMRLAGRLNWWSPSWLRKWHLRFGIWENEPVAILDREFEAAVS